MIVNTSTWKPFRVGDLFDVVRGTSRIMRNLHDGSTPLIAAARAEQGVAGYFDIKPEYANSITVSCNGAGCGSTFFHKGEFAITGDASVLLAKGDFSESALLFIASIFDSRFTSIYSYAEKCGPAVLLNSVVLLPATPDGEPDWTYMETYMQQVLDREEMFAEHLASLTAEAVADGHVIDTSTWKMFHLYDVFDIDMGNKFDRGKMPIGDAVNFVGRTGLNNGVNAVCGYVDGVSPYAPGLITLALGGTIGACFVQTAPFYTSQNVVVLIPPEHVGVYGRLFASSSIYASAASRYKAFSDELNRHIKSDFMFMLPATSDGAPDWAYMEQYMKDVMAIETLFVDELNQMYMEEFVL